VNQNERDHELQSITPTGEFPKKRIKDADAARSIFEKMKEQSKSTALRRAKIQWAYDGNVPIPPSKLKQQGEGWRSNFNPLEMKQRIKERASVLWDMLVSQQTLIKVALRKSEQTFLNQTYGDIVAKNYTIVVKDWVDFNYNVKLSIEQMLLFGNGPFFWDDEIDWRPKALKTGHLLVPNSTKSTIGGVELLLIRSEISPLFFMELFEKEETSRDRGWKLDAVTEAMKAKYLSGQMGQSAPYVTSKQEEHAQLIKNLDFMRQPDLEPINVIHFLVKESDDTVSHMIIPEEPFSKTSNKSNVTNEYLFETNLDKKMEEIVHFFLYDIGDGTLKSVRSLAHLLYGPCDLSMRLLNTLFDGVMISSGLVLKFMNGTSLREFKILKKGPITAIPENLDVIQSSFIPPIENILLARNTIQNIINDKTSQINQNIDPTARPKSASEINAMVAQKSEFKSVDAVWYYTQWEKLHQKMFRKMLNPDYLETDGGYEDHEKLIELCVQDGIPEKLLRDPDNWVVSANIAIGRGSTFEARNITSKLMGILPSIPSEIGRLNLIRDYIGVHASYGNVDRYVPMNDAFNMPTIYHHIAEGENVDMMQGSPRTAASDDLHIVHLNLHVKTTSESINAFKQGGADPQRLLPALANLINHCYQHVEFLHKDPSRNSEFKQFKNIVKELESAARKVEQQAVQMFKDQKQQQAQQQQIVAEAQKQLASQELELKKFEIQERLRLEDERERLKTQSQNENRMAKTRTAVMASRTKTANAIDLSQRTTQADIALRAAKTAADIRNKTEETAAKIKNMNKKGGKEENE
jgi:hypothetical protein